MFSFHSRVQTVNRVEGLGLNISNIRGKGVLHCKTLRSSAADQVRFPPCFVSSRSQQLDPKWLRIGTDITLDHSLMADNIS